jgi:hypothetical protein
MFHPGGRDRKISNARMLAEMIAFLGMPSRDFLCKSDETLAYWNHEGELPDTDIRCRSGSLNRFRRMERLCGDSELYLGGH